MREMRRRFRSEPIFSSTMQEGFGRALILPVRAVLDTRLKGVRFHLWGAFIRNLVQGARIATLASLSCSIANPAERCFWAVIRRKTPSRKLLVSYRLTIRISKMFRIVQHR